MDGQGRHSFSSHNPLRIALHGFLPIAQLFGTNPRANTHTHESGIFHLSLSLPEVISFALECGQ